MGLVMSKELLLKALVCSAAIATLIGSGTTGGSDGSSLQTLSQAHSSKLTFTGEANEGFYTPATGVRLGANNQKFSVVANSSGGFKTVINGKTYEFSSADYNSTLGVYTKKITDTQTVSLFISTGQNSYKYAGAVGAEFIDSASNSQSIGFANYGVKTIAMPTSSAAYTGASRMVIADKTTKLLYSYDGSVSVNADFATNKLSGSIYNLTNNVDQTKFPGQLNIEDVNITHNGYTGSISGSSALNTALNSTVTGNVQGSFYGPNADETAAKFDLSTSNSVAVGFFVAKKP